METTGDNELNAAQVQSSAGVADSGNVEIVCTFFQLDPSAVSQPDVVDKLLAKMHEFQEQSASKQVLELDFEQFRHTASRKIEQLVEDSQKKAREIEELHKQVEVLEQEKTQIVEASRETAEKASELEAKAAQEAESKRTAYQLLDKKQQEVIDLGQEIGRLSELNKTLRESVFTLESAKENAVSESLKAKFETTRLEQELQLTKQTSSWFETELNRKADELARLREESRSQKTALQSELEALKQEYAVAKSSVQSLSDSLREIGVKHDKTLVEVKNLRDKLALQQQEFAEEMAGKDRLNQLLEKSASDRKQRIEELEKMYAELSDRVASEEADYRQQFETLQEQLTAKETELREMESTVANQSDYDTTNVLGDLGRGNSVVLTPLSQKVLKNMGDAYSVTELVSESNRLRKELNKEKRLRARVESELGAIFKELEARMPLLQSYKDKCEEYEARQTQLSAILDSMKKENSVLAGQHDALRKKQEETLVQVRELTQYNTDLKRQVAVLLAQVTLRESGEEPLSRAEKQQLGDLAERPEETETASLITERLSTFRSIPELLEKNRQLLAVSRRLGNELERGESHADEAENEALEKATQAIQKLQQQLQQTETRLEAVSNSRDMLQKLVEGREAETSPAADVSRLQTLAEEQQKQMESLKKDYGVTIENLNVQVRELTGEKLQLSLDLSRARSSCELLAEQNRSAAYLHELAKSEVAELKKSAGLMQQNLTQLENRVQQLTEELLASKSSQSGLEARVKALTSEKSLWQSMESRLRADINGLVDEKTRLATTVAKMQALDNERTASYEAATARLGENLAAVENELQSTRAKLESSNEEIKRILHSKNSDAQTYQKRIDALSGEVASLRESLASKSSNVEQLSEQLATVNRKYQEISNRKNSAMAAINASGDTAEDVVALKRELTQTLEDLELANANAEQYKEVANAAERELAALNETYEKFRQASEESEQARAADCEKLRGELARALEQRDGLEKRVLELETANRDLQAKVGELNATIDSFDAVKKDYETQFAKLRDEMGGVQAALREKQQEVAGKTDEWQQLVAEREKAQGLVGELQQRVQGLEAQLAGARADVSAAEERLEQEKQELVRELRAKEARVTELDVQNRTLINQLESRVSVGDVGEDGDMKSLITYLHRERDSLAQQLEYSRVEEKRLRQAAALAQSEAAEARAELARVQEESASSTKYTEVLAEMQAAGHELELFKDNNRQLREENSRLAARLEQLEQRAAAAEQKCGPLEQQVAQLQSELEIRESQQQLVVSQMEYWKKRVEEKGEESGSTAEVANLQSELEAARNSERQLQERYDKLRAEAQDKLNKSRVARQQLNTEKDALAARIRELEEQAQQAQPDTATSELEQKVRDAVAASSRIKVDYDIQVNRLEAEISRLRAEIKQSQPVDEAAIRQQIKAECDAELEAHKKRIRAPVQAKINEVIEQRWKARKEELEKEFAQKQSATDELLKRFEQEKEQLKKDTTAAIRKETEFKENILKKQLASLREKVKTLEAKRPAPAEDDRADGKRAKTDN
ncbi:hypothetical protein KL949_001302 [Ogataea haglerorum]|nr:hypothetical protein KL913_001692 [Ogataea haglerorum]KAG7721570.1 hypothetical protein KL949_001302 [Ogataea haglerorum]